MVVGGAIGAIFDGRAQTSLGFRGATPPDDSARERVFLQRGPATPGGGASVLPSPSDRPFETFPDFSRVNASRHNASRSNTFNTPSGLVRKGQSSGPTKDLASLSSRELLDVCELSFAKNLRDLHHSLLREMKEEIHQALGPLKEELSGTVADARGALAMEEVLRRVSEIQIPAVDLSPVLEEVRSSKERQEAVASQLDGHLADEVAALRAEIREVLRHQEQTEQRSARRIAELEECMRRSEGHLSQVVDMQQALTKTSAQTAKDLQIVHQDSTKHFEFLIPTWEAKLVERFQEPVKVDFGQVVGTIRREHQVMATDISMLLNEIGKVQQALNVDFVQVLDLKLNDMQRMSEIHVPRDDGDGAGGRRTGHKSMLGDVEGLRRPSGNITSVAQRAKKRVREIGNQTELALAAEASCQTEFRHDPNADKKKGKKKRADGGTDAPSKPAPRKQVFADAEEMKRRAREALVRPQYNVFDYYHDTGVSQQIAKSSTFENLTLVVIFFNAIWIAVDTDLNNAEIIIQADPLFQVVENGFCLFFSMELFIRFSAFRWKRSCLVDGWFLFDALLVMMMVMETWALPSVLLMLNVRSTASFGKSSILRLVRAVRLLRISRMARLLRSVPELLILLKGMKAASRSVGVFFALWLMIIYVYALMFRQLAEDKFNSVPEAMNMLLWEGLLPDHAQVANELVADRWFFWPIIFSFVVVAVLTLMNMLIGVLVEVVGAIASTEKEGIAIVALATEMREAMTALHWESGASLSKSEFVRLLTEPEVARIVAGFGVDVVSLMEMAENVFEDLAKQQITGGMPFEGLIDLLLNMRGANPVRVKDVKEQLKLIKSAVHDATAAIAQRFGEEMVFVRHELRELRDATEAMAKQNSEEGSDYGDFGAESGSRHVPMLQDAADEQEVE